jgi:predicted DNA-binding transcriptional regulator YafY
MRADRLISLVLLLRARGRMTAQTLAEELEVSERTIYRDLDALSAAGIPVCTLAGTNGGVYLDEAYRHSLTTLSRAEVQSLFIASGIGPLQDLGLARASEESHLKLLEDLPHVHRAEVERMRQRFYIDPANWFQRSQPSPYFALLQQAVWEDRPVWITYQPVETPESERQVDAYALVAKANVWYLVGKKQQGPLHNYRIARLKGARLADGHFQRDPAFDLPSYWEASCRQFEEENYYKHPPYQAVFKVHPAAYWYFPGYLEGRYEQIEAADEAGWVTLRLTVDSMEEARMRALGLGAYVRVIAPDALRASIIETARAVVEFYEGGTSGG